MKVVSSSPRLALMAGLLFAVAQADESVSAEYLIISLVVILAIVPDCALAHSI
jgi:uncharacterized tellurite resistance protein B-like protein